MRPLALALGCLAAAALSSCDSKGGPFKIGVILPLSGDTASYGISVRRGIELALADERAAGLTNVELVYEDGHCEGRSAANAANKLISLDKVRLLVGEVCSGGTLAVAPIAHRRKIPLITPASTSPMISKAGPFMFRTIPSDALQGAFAADLMKKKGFRRVAVLYPNEDYGIGFKKVFESGFAAAGGQITASETFERGSVDLRAQITKVRESKPDAVFLICNSPDSALAAIRQIRETGVKVPLFGSEGIKTKETAELAAAEGTVITSVSAGHAAFAEKLKKAYGEDPGPYAAQGYDAMRTAAAAIRAAGPDADGAKLRDAIRAVTFEGVSGTIRFDDHGDIAGNYEVLVVRKGKFEKLEP